MKKMASGFRTGFIAFSVALAAFVFAAGCSAADVQQAELEKQFEEMMTGATLEGSFTINGREDEPLRKEKYTISSVTKLPGGYWTINTRIQYGGRDVTLPVPVKIEWAGDTPVATLTDAEIPGLGTFTARVLFYRGQYAGTWSHGDVVGNQFGRIIKAAPEN
jgi:hypothetical protein